jgi:hypothetical protein
MEKGGPYVDSAGNIHWLGMRDHRDLPPYFDGWDLGMLPFAVKRQRGSSSPQRRPST